MIFLNRRSRLLRHSKKIKKYIHSFNIRRCMKMKMEMKMEMEM